VAQLLIWFVLLFYVPTLLFRFVATRFVDLGRRRIPNQIEDFFAAALPSVALNAIAWFILNTATLWHFAEFTGTLPLLLTTQAVAVMRQNILLVCGYVTVLLTTAASFGAIYGWVDLQTTILTRDVARNRPGEIWAWAVRVHDFWAVFFRAEGVMQFPWVVRPTYVYVRTTDRLYYGRVDSYDRGSDGEIAGITLNRVRRFSVKTREECLATGTAYVRRLYGSFYMKWSTIVDINVADIGRPATMVRIQSAFRKDRNRTRKPETFGECP